MSNRKKPPPLRKHALSLAAALQHADAMAPRDRPDLVYTPSDEQIQVLSSRALRVLASTVRSLQRQLRAVRSTIAKSPPPPAGAEQS